MIDPFRLILCFLVIIVSIVLAIIVCFFSPLPFWWMFAIIPIDAIIIWALIRSWEREQAENDQRELAQL